MVVPNLQVTGASLTMEARHSGEDCSLPLTSARASSRPMTTTRAVWVPPLNGPDVPESC